VSDILHWKKVKTRKPHKCFGCAKTYPEKTEMIHAAYTDGGQAFGCYWCDTCVEYMHEYFASGDEVYRLGEIFDNDPEGWEVIRSKAEAT